jgi:hypothetical protein
LICQDLLQVFQSARNPFAALQKGLIIMDKPEGVLHLRFGPSITDYVQEYILNTSAAALKSGRKAHSFARGRYRISRRSYAMSAPTSRFAVLIALGAVCLAGNAAFAAEPVPDSENGRYTFSPAADGLMRLDTRTGTVSNCSNSAAGWACFAVPDERKALDEEIGRLQAENEKLKTQLAAREPAKSENKQAAPDVADGQRKIEIPLPSDQDMDRVMSFLQRAWKRLVEMANQMQKDVAGNGKI